MSFACVNLESGSCCSTERILGKHSLYCCFHSKLGLLCHDFLVLYALETADVAGVSLIVLLLKLLTCKNCLLGVDDDNEVSAVNVGCEFRSVLSAEKVCCDDCGSAKRLTCRVDDIPFADNCFFFLHKSRHFVILQIKVHFLTSDIISQGKIFVNTFFEKNSIFQI